MSESGNPGLDATAPGTDPPATQPRATKTRGGGGGDSLGRYRIVGRVGGGEGAGGDGTTRELLRARDPQLERRLVIRVERPAEQTEQARAELLAQARAMAKLEHPAIIPIFDVGATDDGVFVVMPDVGGATLETWLSGKRTWRDVLTRYVHVGRGLAAAHAAGMVHPRFAAAAVEVGEGGEVVIGELVTADSDGRDAKRADTRRFAESLREALRDRSPPSWLVEMVERGASDDALAATLDAIEGRQRRPRRLAIGAGGVAVVAAAVTLGFVATREPSVSCPDPAPRLAGVWDAGVKDKVTAAFDQANVPYARDMLARLVPTLDGHTEAWRSGIIETCRTHAGGRRETALFDKRMRCYGRWLDELGGVTGLLAGVSDRKSVEVAAATAREVDGVGECADVEALAKVPEPPPEQRAQTEAIEREVLEIEKLRHAGKMEGLVERSAANVERARAIGHATPLTRALQEHFYVLRLGRDVAAMRTTLEDLARTAASGGHDPTSAHAWIELYRLVGSELGLPDEAKQILPAAQAAVARAGSWDTLQLRVLLLKNEAEVIDDHGEAQRALALLEEARALLRDAKAYEPGSEHTSLAISVTAALGSALGSAGDFEKSIEAYREVIRTGGELLGSEHPQVASMRANLGETYRRAGKYEEALSEYREVARIMKGSLGESSALVRAHERTGAVLLELDKLEDGVRELETALAVADRVLQPNDPVRLGVLGTYAQGLRDLKRYDEALRRFDEVIAALEAVKTNPGTLMTAVHNRAGTLREMKRWDESIAGYTRVIAMYDAAPGNEKRVMGSLVGLGMALVEAGRPGLAIAPLERAVAITTPGRNEGLQRAGHFFLGRARVEARRDAARGFEEVRAARASMVAAGDEAEDLAVVDEWLAKQKPR